MIWVATGSRKNIEHVQATLKADEAVADVKFASAEQQLGELREEHPELVDALPNNPLPHKFTARLRPSADAHEVVERYRALDLPGVMNVKYEREDALSSADPFCVTP